MKKIITLLFVLLISVPVYSFKVVGYLPSYRFYALNSIDFSKLTHVMVSFANPNVDGDFSYSEDISKVIDKAHPNNCKVFISIGGGGLSEAVETIYETQTEVAHRSAFIHKLMDFAREEGIDGIDVDLEGSMVQMATYDGYVQELIDSAHASGMEVSAALAKWTGTRIDNATVQKLDFLNLMSYDFTGPWTGPGQHSPMSQTSGDFSFWKGKGVSSQGLIIGLPFYGYEFQSGSTPAWTWCQIVTEFPDSLNQDEIVTNDGVLYFNGMPTIEEKIEYSNDNNAGGVMIWELGQDCFDDNSLLDFIDESIQNLNSFNDLNSLNVSVYPNPVNDIITIKAENEFEFQILDLTGKIILSNKVNSTTTIDVSNLKSSVYLLVTSSGTATYTTRLVKK